MYLVYPILLGTYRVINAKVQNNSGVHQTRKRKEMGLRGIGRPRKIYSETEGRIVSRRRKGMKEGVKEATKYCKK